MSPPNLGMRVQDDQSHQNLQETGLQSIATSMQEESSNLLIEKMFQEPAGSASLAITDEPGKWTLKFHNLQFIKGDYPLEKYPNITHLRANCCLLTWNTLLSLAKFLPNLSNVSSNCWRYNDRLLNDQTTISKWVQLYPHLKELSLTDCFVSDDALQIMMRGMPELESLVINRNCASTDIFVSMGLCLPKLKQLQASGLKQGKQSNIQHLGNLKHLSTLLIGLPKQPTFFQIQNQDPFFQITNSNLPEIVHHLASFPSLLVLSIYTNCSNIVAISKLRTLKKLTITNRSALGSINILKIMRNIRDAEVAISFPSSNDEPYMSVLKGYKKQLFHRKELKVNAYNI